MLKDNSLQMDEFPDDEVERVVWLFGAVHKNLSLSGVPLVEIALKRINSDYELDTKIEIYKIPLPQIDVVRLGSIWIGMHPAKKNWKGFKNHESGMLFHFDFHEQRPNCTKLFIDKVLVDLEKDVYRLDEIKSNYYRSHFRLTEFCHLTSINAFNVLIPSLELLTSTYTPKEQQIRLNLFLKSLAEISKEYIVKSEIKKSINDDVEYQIILKKNKHVSNISFLAFIELNKSTKRTISILKTSIQKAEKKPDGTYYRDVYPRVLPYHPDSLTIKVDGHWIDKKTFFVLRINAYNLPSTPSIWAEYESNEYVASSKVSDSHPLMSQKPTDQTTSKPVVKNHVDPHINTGAVYTTSEVELLEEPISIKIIKNSGNKKFTERSHHNNSEKNKSGNKEETNISSGNKKYSKKCNGTKQLKQEENETRENQFINDIFTSVICALNALVKNKKIKSIQYLSAEAENIECGILAMLPRKMNWVPKNAEGLRQLLIVSIVTNENKCIYLLEIQRMTKSEKFSGLLFIFNEGIPKENLRALLTRIVKNKGRYRQNSKKETSVSAAQLGKCCSELYEGLLYKGISYNHQFGSKMNIRGNEVMWEDKLITSIEKIVGEGE